MGRPGNADIPGSGGRVMKRQLSVGQAARVTRTFTEGDLSLFAHLSGAPATTPSAVPAPLLAGLFSYLLGRHLPGFGTNYLKQELHYPHPAPADQPVTAEVRITRLRPEKHLVDLEAQAILADGTVVCRGRSLVLVADLTP